MKKKINDKTYDLKPHADLQGADLQGANLRWADLRWANLQRANLQRANLRWADLRWADLQGANLRWAKLPGFQIPQEGELIVWKKGAHNALIKLKIPASAKRTASLVGRKCRASEAKVLEIISHECEPLKTYSGWWTSGQTTYTVGQTTKPDKYDPDIRVECTHGIHFFLSREEAEVF